MIPEPDIEDWKRGQRKADLIAARVSVERGHHPIEYWKKRVDELELLEETGGEESHHRKEIRRR